MKVTLKLLITLFIALSLLISSCGGYIKEDVGGRLVDFSTLKYQRPDYAAFKARIEECRSRLESGGYNGEENKKALFDELDEITDIYYYDMQTMAEIAFINYCFDITNTETCDEYYDIYAELQIISTHLDELYYACAKCEHVDYIEEAIFGEGFFDSYVGEYYMPDGLIDLYEEESELLKSYSEAMSDMFCEYRGRIYTYEELLNIQDDRLYENVRSAFMDKYNRVLGEIYVELVAVRNEIAELLEYESYAEYAYYNSLGREYEPDQADKYIEGVKEHVTPVYLAHRYDAELAEYSVSRMSPEKTVSVAGNVVSRMSGELYGIYKEMNQKKLCSVNSSEKMYYGSYQTYLNSYETPYVFVNGIGNGTDVLTLLHEFGHFSSSYYNYGAGGSNDECEVASQALELIASDYLGEILQGEEARLLKTYELFYILSSVNECAAWTAFENMAYADPDLTLEECNEYYEEISLEFGLVDSEGYGDDVRGWVLISHIFESPYYSIGYSVSANVAVQLYELEIDEKGKGVEAYITFIKLAQNNDFFGNIEESGLTSPFAEGSVKRFADTLNKELSAIIRK